MNILIITSLLIIIYTFLGYPLIIWLLAKVNSRKTKISFSGQLPEITFLIPTYNEELFIEEKIKNTLALDYPNSKIRIWVVADGSNDATYEIASKFQQVRVFHKTQRRGKIHAVNRIMNFVSTPVTILSDANALLNKGALKEMVKHFQNSSVAAVSGEKKIHWSDKEDAVSSGEGIYWKYESFLKSMDARAGSLVGAAGELIAIRTSAFEPIPEDVIIEDFYMSMKFCMEGYRVEYEPKAYSVEKSSEDVSEELKRKIRICAGGLQSVFRLRSLLNPFKFGFITFQYVSHRVLRWTVTPIALIVLFVATFLTREDALTNFWIYQIQLVFYTIGLVGYFLQRWKVKIKGIFIPYYFVVMNFSVFLGLFKLLWSKNLVVWDKSARKL